MNEPLDLAAADLPPETVIDHFRVIRLLGRGGMGEVYLARDTRLGRKVALKLVRPEALGSGDAVERFLFEARATAAFAHPHIVTVYEAGAHGGRPYVALEYLEGRTLRQRLQEGRPAVRETIRIGQAIAEAMREAHANGLLHRDLKPENVLLPKDGRLRVVDFGLAKRVSDERVSVLPGPGELATLAAAGDAATMLGVPAAGGGGFETRGGRGIRGTPLYMAPEQWDDGAVGVAADMWAFGLLLLELLNGRHPFEGMGIYPICARVCGSEPMPGVEGEVPEALRQLVGRCLQRAAERRPTAAEAVEVLASLLGGARAEAVEERSPFRGLEPFGERHADLFFGRDGEIAAFLERLRDEAVLPVVGPSGAGKSSFVQAGVIPRLREARHWVVLRLRPGREPLRALAARVLAGDRPAATGSALSPAASAAPNVSADGVAVSLPPGVTSTDALDDERRRAAELQEAPARLALWLEALAERERAGVLLFVDQLEEVFTLVDDPEVRARFLAALAGAADDPERPVRVIFTLREDFLGRAAESPEMREALGRVTVLRSPPPDALRQILRRPVEAVGYGWDDPTLVDEMAAQVGGEPAALPLLQFAGQLLWDRRDRERRLLLRAAHDEAGGVIGALAHHADGVLAGLSGDDVRLARDLLLRLVTDEGTRRTLPRAALLEGLDPAAREVLDRLVRTRTVQVRKGRRHGTDEAEVELAHESLIRNWPRLARWIEEGRDEMAFLGEVGRAAELWERRGRRDAEVWQGDALRDALRRAARIPVLPPPVRRFLDAGRARDRRRSRRLAALLGAGFLLLAAVAAVLARQRSEAVRQRAEAVVQREQAETERERAETERERAETERERAETERVRAEAERERAERERAETLREGAEAALARGAALEARAKLRMALAAEDSPHARGLWRRLRRLPLLWERRFSFLFWDLAWTPDGTSLTLPGAVATGAVTLVDGRTGETASAGLGKGVVSVAYSADGRRMATAEGPDAVVYDREDGRTVCRVATRFGLLGRVRLNGDGSLLAVADSSFGDARVYEIPTGRLLHTLPARAWRVEFGPGDRLAAGGSDGRIRVWNARSGDLLLEVAGHGEAVQHALLSPDGSRLASCSNDLTVRIHDAADGTVRQVLRMERTRPMLLAWGKDGRLAVGDDAGRVGIWDAGTGTRLMQLRAGDPEIISALAFSADGRRVGAATVAGSIRAWDLGADPAVGEAGHAGYLSAAALDPGGERVATAATDGGPIHLWDAATGRPLGQLEGYDRAVLALRYDRTGKRLAAACTDGGIRIWRPLDGETPEVLRGHQGRATAVDFRPDGRDHLASASEDQRARIWDLGTGRTLHVLAGHRRRVSAVRYRPDGRVLATASFDGTIRLWDAETGEPQRVLGEEGGVAVWEVAWAEGGTRLLALLGDRSLVSWDPAAGTARTLRPAEPDAVNQAARLELHPDGRRAGLCTRGVLRLVDPVEGTELRSYRDVWSGCVALGFSADGRTVLLDGGWSALLWDAEADRPRWFAPAAVTDPPALFSHRGWESLDGDGGRLPAEGTAWRAAVESSARFAAASDDGRRLCLLTWSGTLEVWDLAADRRTGVLTAPPEAVTAAMGEQCLLVQADAAFLVDARGRPTRLEAEFAGFYDVDPQAIYLATRTELAVFDRTGRRTGGLHLPRTAVAAARTPVGLAVGYLEDGSVEVVRDDGTPVSRLRATPINPPQHLVAGPGGTVVALYTNGTVGIWDAATGDYLDGLKLHGTPIHSFLRHGRLYLATHVGDRATVDLRPCARDWCDLLREVWSEVPVEWEGGRAVLRPPPADHPCAAAR